MNNLRQRAFQLRHEAEDEKLIRKFMSEALDKITVMDEREFSYLLSEFNDYDLTALETVFNSIAMVFLVEYLDCIDGNQIDRQCIKS